MSSGGDVRAVGPEPTLRRLSGPDTGARQGTVRRHNLSLVLRQIVDADPPLSRADLVGATGLAKGTVSAIVDALIGARLVREMEPAGSSRVGRPAVPLAAARKSVAGLGIEIGPGRLGARAVDLSGALLAQSVVDVDNRRANPVAAFAAVGRAVQQVVAVVEGDGCRIAGACLAVPGLLDGDSGLLRASPSLGWFDLDLRRLLAQAGVGATYPVVVRNGARLAGLAETRLSGRDGGASFVYITGETEVEAAVVVDGGVLRGVHGWAGALGHVTVDPRGPACPCGKRGCLEQYIGLEAIWRSSGRRGEADKELLLAALELGDRSVVRAIAQAGQVLGRSLSDLLNVLDVEHIVLGGLLGLLTPYLAPEVLAQLRRHVLSARWSTFGVRASLNGDRAAIIGAAHEALRAVIDDPGQWIALSEQVAAR